MTQIAALGPGDLDAYVEHMSRHAVESGRDGDPIFLPWNSDSTFDRTGFRDRRRRSWNTTVGEPGWARSFGLWDGERLVGHIELRGGVLATERHRVELGMGLERSQRGSGHGRALLETALSWAREQPFLRWVDLGVFAHNAVARGLYERCGFVERGRTKDRWRVDGTSIDDVSMSLDLTKA